MNKNSEYFLTASGLNFRYGVSQKNSEDESDLILKDVNIVLKKGFMYSIIGPNGSGKTTLIKCLNSSHRPQSGEIFIFGEDIKKMNASQVARRVAYMPQRTVIDFDFSVWDIVLMGRHAQILRFKGESAVDVAACREAMELCGVWEFRDRNFNTLSGGEMQKVVLARCIAQETDLLLLDEPLTYLDIRNQLEFLEILQEIIRVKKVTVVAVVHDINMAYQYSDYVYVMSHGEVIAEGAPEEVINAANMQLCFGVCVDMLENSNDGRKVIVPRIAKK